jgi:AcrR family transcriptional regulator
MPKLKPDTQRARREHILDAAEQCFARSGFHRTTMQDICREAHVSPGALYVYFSSKEDLIAGIVERDRAKFTEQLKELASAPDLMAALEKVAEHYTVEEPHHKRVLNLEMGAESTRNPAVGEIFRSVDSFCLDSIERLFARAREEGKIAPSMDVRTLAQILSLIGDGLYWRTAVDPALDAKALMPAITNLIRTLINPVETGSGTQKTQSREAAQ